MTVPRKRRRLQPVLLLFGFGVLSLLCVSLLQHQVLKSSQNERSKAAYSKAQIAHPTSRSFQETTNAPFNQKELERKVDTSSSSIDFRRELYQYHPPEPRKATDVQSTECGSFPEYEAFFSQTEKFRSAVKEDVTMYNLFFKDQVITGKKKKFTYVEIGGFDGITESNSRFYDRCLGWYVILYLLTCLYFSLSGLAASTANLFVNATTGRVY